MRVREDEESSRRRAGEERERGRRKETSERPATTTTSRCGGPASPARREERSVHSLSDQNLRLPWMRWMPLRVSCTCLGIYSFEPFISRAARVRALCPFAAGWPFLLLFLSFTRASAPTHHSLCDFELRPLSLSFLLSRAAYLTIALSLSASIASSLSGLLRRVLPAANLLPSAKIRARTINFWEIPGDSRCTFFFFTSF